MAGTIPRRSGFLIDSHGVSMESGLDGRNNPNYSIRYSASTVLSQWSPA